VSRRFASAPIIDEPMHDRGAYNTSGSGKPAILGLANDKRRVCLKLGLGGVHYPIIVLVPTVYEYSRPKVRLIPSFNRQVSGDHQLAKPRRGPSLTISHDLTWAVSHFDMP
jgi:hypothetical protein